MFEMIQFHCFDIRSPSVRQFVYIVDREGAAPGWFPFYVANPPVGVISGRDHNDFIFEKGELLRADCSAVHQSLDTLLMWPAARNHSVPAGSGCTGHSR